MLHDEDRTPRPRVPTPFLGVPLRLLMKRSSVPSMIGGCAPCAPLSWSHSTRSWMPMEYSHALVSEKRPTSLLMDRSALLQAVRHPARDHVGAHPVQCVWLSDVWAPSILASHGTLGVMLRSVEVSSEASEAIRTCSSLSRLALQPASISRGCQALPAAATDTRQVVQATTALRCGHVFNSPLSAKHPKGLISCRGIHIGHVWIHLDKRGE